jgi:hypothetical protein
MYVQVVGSKSVVLFALEHSAALYPHEGIMCNTSRVDVGAPLDSISSTGRCLLHVYFYALSETFSGHATLQR